MYYNESSKINIQMIVVEKFTELIMFINKNNNKIYIAFSYQMLLINISFKEEIKAARYDAL